MKVVHISTVHVDTDTRIVEKECKGLVQRGFDVILVIPADKDEVRDGVYVAALLRPPGRLYRFVITAFHAYRRARRFKPDIYHIHDPELLLLGLWLSICGHNVVYDMHENVPEQIMTKHWIPRFFRQPLAAGVKLLERLVLNRFAVVMAELSYAKAYDWVVRKKVVLNLPKVDKLERLGRQAIKYDVPTVGYIGGVSVDRGAISMLRAIQLVRENGLDVQFLCIGPVADDVTASEEFCRALEEGWINAPGRLSPEEGWAEIARCHVGLAVLMPIGNYINSYPTKMFEYMSMGLPVIVSKFPLYQAIVERYDCGRCVDPEDSGALADALLDVLSNNALADDMSKRGLGTVKEHYNWEGELDCLCELYGQLTKESGVR